MIGYYVHHQGHGHLHRARSIAESYGGPLDGLSTHPRPSAWPGSWIELAEDAGAPDRPGTSADGWLHYAPVGHPGYAERMRQLSAWIANRRPEALVVDVSVEVALLARLHGVPVVTMAGPGRRGDITHRLGYGISDRVLAPWPAEAADLLDQGTSGAPVLVHPLGAISRYAPVSDTASVEPGSVLVLAGSGGTDVTSAHVDRAADATPTWSWRHLSPGRWVADPWPLLCAAEVVVSHCGQNAVAEIAAARRPAVLIPQERHFGEQGRMARVLRELGMPALVLDAWPTPDAWDRVLKEAAGLDPAGWAVWNDGLGASRAAAVLRTYENGTRVSAA